MNYHELGQNNGVKLSHFHMGFDNFGGWCLGCARENRLGCARENNSVVHADAAAAADDDDDGDGDGRSLEVKFPTYRCSNSGESSHRFEAENRYSSGKFRRIASF